MPRGQIERTDTTKRCVTCGEFKPYDHFARQPSKTLDGHANKCKICHNAYNKTKRSNLTDEEKVVVAEYKSIWFQQNKDRIYEKTKIKNAEITENGVSRIKEWSIRKFGVDIHWYLSKLKEQNYVCFMCKKPEKAVGKSGEPKMLAIDHDHKTGKVRALLCANCNNGLGCFNDDTILMQKGIDYIDHFKNKEV